MIDWRSFGVGFIAGVMLAASTAYAITTTEILRSVYNASDTALEVTIVP